MSALLAAALLFQVQNLRQPEKPCPFVVVTAAGSRVGSLDRPVHDRKPLRFRDCTTGTLTLLPASEVDWPATEQANAAGPAPAVSSSATPVPTRPSLSGLAKRTSLLDAEDAVRRNETSSGKMKIGGREVSLDDTAPFFGKESVARHLKLSAFVADTTGCPENRARAYGSVKNVSRMKLRDLKALVVIGSLRTGDLNGQVQSMDPSDLMPGEESEIHLWLSCDWAQRAGTGRAENIVVLLPDVAGRTEEVAKPDGTNPFDAPPRAKAGAPPAPH